MNQIQIGNLQSERSIHKWLCWEARQGNTIYSYRKINWHKHIRQWPVLGQGSREENVQLALKWCGT